MRKSISIIIITLLLGAFSVPTVGCVVRTGRSSQGVKSKPQCKRGKVLVKKNGKYKCKKPKKHKGKGKYKGHSKH